MTTNLAERTAFSAAVSALDAVPYWDVQDAIFTREPTTRVQPHVWRWAEFRPKLYRALDLVDTAEAERRVLILRNPGLAGPDTVLGGVTHTLYMNYQIIRPGEIARAHRHSASAFRFVIEGEGAYTAVDGEKTVMHPGDFVLTPNGVWHDHGCEGEEPVVWLDGLDIPVVRMLHQIFFDPYPKGEQQAAYTPDNQSWSEWGQGMRPLGAAHRAPHSPIINYRWERAVTALQVAAAKGHTDPYDGVIIEYTNPLTGGPALPTIGAHLQLLAPGALTEPHQHTSATAYCVAQGHGATEINGTWYEWGPHDVFVVPTWAVHRHRVHSDEPAIMFSETDAPVLRALGLYRERATQ